MTKTARIACIVCFAVAVFNLTIGPALADTLRVPDQYATIQAAVDAAQAGDVVEIADGTYTGAGNKDLDFAGKALTVRGASGDPALCTIDCEGEGRGFYFHSEEGADSVVEALTITHGFIATVEEEGDVVEEALGGGVRCDDSSPTFVNCVISENTSETFGGGMYLSNSQSRIINCSIRNNSSDRVGGGMYLSSSQSQIINCSIRNNSSDRYGGGAYLQNSDSTLVDCLLYGNRARRDGGGLFCVGDSSPTFDRCTIFFNRATEGDGGGACIDGASTPLFTHCTIEMNFSTSTGGGVCCTNSSRAAFEDCTINHNTSAYGGGVYLWHGSNATLANCTIRGNVAASEGGGVVCNEESNPIITNCTISENAAAYGGGFRCRNSHGPTLYNCVITNNRASAMGGGIHCNNSSPAFTNCTASGNQASQDGGGASAIGASSPSFANCILWNSATREFNLNDDSVVEVTFCDVQGGWPGAGNIDADPLFAFANDQHLTPGSPCIDAGDNAPIGGLPVGDKEGSERLTDGDEDGQAVVDIGAYEFDPAKPAIALSTSAMEFVMRDGDEDPPAQTLDIRNAAAGTLAWSITGQAEWLMVEPRNGESAGAANQATISVSSDGMAPGRYEVTLGITDAQAVNSPATLKVMFRIADVLEVPAEYPTIQSAVDAALIGDEVIVADGVYAGEGNKDLSLDGKAITLRSASGDPALCVIDCEGAGRGFYFGSVEQSDTIVKGFTIRHGGDVSEGGGVYCYENCNPTIVDCAVIDCDADEGGGVFSLGAGTFVNCRIIGCSARLWGGGVISMGSGVHMRNCDITGNAAAYGGGLGTLNSSPIMQHCRINGNYCSSQGGGIYCITDLFVSTRNPRLIACEINNNVSAVTGGGVCCVGSNQTELIGCTVCANSCLGGGGIFADASSLKLVNCTMYANEAIVGAALACDSQTPNEFSNVQMYNCVLSNGPDSVWNNDGSELSLAYCNVRHGAGEPWFGDGCIDADPLLVDPDGPDDDPNTWLDNDYRIAPTSPCIDAGENAAVPADSFDLDDDGDTDEPTPYDLDGKARFIDDVATPDTGVGDPPLVDMGAYEFAPGDLDNDGDVDLSDLAELLSRYGACAGDPDYNLTADFDASGCIDLSDLACLLSYYGMGT